MGKVKALFAEMTTVADLIRTAVLVIVAICAFIFGMGAKSNELSNTIKELKEKVSNSEESIEKLQGEQQETEVQLLTHFSRQEEFEKNLNQSLLRLNIQYDKLIELHSNLKGSSQLMEDRPLRYN